MTAGHDLPGGFLSERAVARLWGMPSASLRYWRVQGYLRDDLVPQRFGEKVTSPLGYPEDPVRRVAEVGAGIPASQGGALKDTFYSSSTFTAMAVGEQETPAARQAPSAGVSGAASEDAPPASIADTPDTLGGPRW